MQDLYCEHALVLNTTEEARILDLIVDRLHWEAENGCGCPLFEGNRERSAAALKKPFSKELLDRMVKIVEEMKAEQQSLVERKQYFGRVDKLQEKKMNMHFANAHEAISALKGDIENA